MDLQGRQSSSAVSYDTEGRKILFDKITFNGVSIHVAEIDNSGNPEIPTGQIFTVFGHDKVLKAQLLDDLNKIRISVLDSRYYVYSHEPKVLNVTYGDMKSLMDEYPNGKCVDTIVCASYKNYGQLTLVPYVYDWKYLPIMTKMIHIFLICLIVIAITYFAKDSSNFKEFFWVCLFFLKENIYILLHGLSCFYTSNV